MKMNYNEELAKQYIDIVKKHFSEDVWVVEIFIAFLMASNKRLLTLEEFENAFVVFKEEIKKGEKSSYENIKKCFDNNKTEDLIVEEDNE